MTTHRPPFVGRETYDGYDRNGTSKTIRGVRVGRGRWRVEITLTGLWARLGAGEFFIGFGWADEDAR